MRVYEGAPRQNYQEVLRSLGAMLDQRGMREISLTEVSEGFIVQGLAPVAGESSWSESGPRVDKETFTFFDEDIARFMDEAMARRGLAPADAQTRPTLPSGFYEKALRVLGAYVDQQKPRDIFFLEQDHAFVLRLLMPTRTGARHVLAEFTSDDIEGMVAGGPQMRGAPATSSGSQQPTSE